MVENRPASSIFIEYSRQIIRVILDGRIDDAEAVAIYQRVSSLQEFRDGFGVLFDSTAIQEPLVTGLGQLHLANLSENDTNLVAILVGSAATAGMAQMFKICANWKAERIGVFSDEDLAMTWLTNRTSLTK